MDSTRPLKYRTSKFSLRIKGGMGVKMSSLVVLKLCVQENDFRSMSEENKPEPHSHHF